MYILRSSPSSCSLAQPISASHHLMSIMLQVLPCLQILTPAVSGHVRSGKVVWQAHHSTCTYIGNGFLKPKKKPPELSIAHWANRSRLEYLEAIYRKI